MSVVEELRAFLQTEVPPLRERWGDATGWDARCAWQRTLQTGRWAAPAWPAEFGGRGLEIREILECEELLTAAGCPMLPGVLGLQNVGPTLIAWGDERQRAHLPAILTTDEVWCQGFSEPGAGSDLAGLRTRAVLDGDEFIVNGQKIWTSNGMQATHMELLVRTDPDAPKHRGISVLLVEMDSPGIERRPIRQLDGAAEFAEVFFTDVRVPARNLLGPLNDGWRVTMTTLGHERSAIAKMAIRVEGDLRTTIDAHRADARGEPLPPALRDELVERYVESRVLAALGEQMLAKVAGGGEPGAEQSVIKLVLGEVMQRIDATTLAIGGLDAVIGTDGGAARAYLTGRAITIAGGTTQIVKNILAERVLGLPRQ
jgi:alkylation response protein AidB-like acyl-CoA dehydrogenase